MHQPGWGVRVCKPRSRKTKVPHYPLVWRKGRVDGWSMGQGGGRRVGQKPTLYPPSRRSGQPNRSPLNLPATVRSRSFQERLKVSARQPLHLPRNPQPTVCFPSLTHTSQARNSYEHASFSLLSPRCGIVADPQHSEPRRSSHGGTTTAEPRYPDGGPSLR